MALPLAPVAGIAIRYGAVALTAYAISRKVQRAQTYQPTEDILDRVEEGVAVNAPKDRGQLNAQSRYRRVVRLGQNGPGVEIDVAAIGRIKIRKI